jgi:tetratricopeptide (TPR) repeat protein
MRAVLLLSLLGFAGAAHALDDQDTEIAKRHFNAGKALYAAQKYDQAIVEFEKAREVKPLPAFDYNIGLCHDRLEHLAEAIAAYRRFLDGTNDPKEKIEPGARVKVLEERLAKAQAQAAPKIEAGAAKKSPTLAIAVAGVAVATLAMGSILLGVTGHDYDQLHDSCAPFCDRSSWSDLPARADAGYALIAIGALAAAVDVALWVIAKRAPRSERATAATGIRF